MDHVTTPQHPASAASLSDEGNADKASLQAEILNEEEIKLTGAVRRGKNFRLPLLMYEESSSDKEIFKKKMRDKGHADFADLSDGEKEDYAALNRAMLRAANTLKLEIQEAMPQATEKSIDKVMRFIRTAEVNSLFADFSHYEKGRDYDTLLPGAYPDRPEVQDQVLEKDHLLAASDARLLLVKGLKTGYQRFGDQGVPELPPSTNHAKGRPAHEPAQTGWLTFVAYDPKKAAAKKPPVKKPAAPEGMTAENSTGDTVSSQPKVKEAPPPEPAPKKLVWRLHLSAPNIKAQWQLATLASNYGVAEFSCANRKLLAAVMQNQPATKGDDPKAEKANTNVGGVVVTYSEKNAIGEKINWGAFLAEASAIMARYPKGRELIGGRKVKGHTGMTCMLEPEELRMGWRNDVRDGHSILLPPKEEEAVPQKRSILHRARNHPVVKGLVLSGSIAASGFLLGRMSVPSGIPLEPEAPMAAQGDGQQAMLPKPVFKKNTEKTDVPAAPAATPTAPLPEALVITPSAVAEIPKPKLEVPTASVTAMPEEIKLEVPTPEVSLKPTRAHEALIKLAKEERAQSALGLLRNMKAIGQNDIPAKYTPQLVTDAAQIAGIATSAGLDRYLPAGTAKRAQVTSNIYIDKQMPPDGPYAVSVVFMDDKDKVLAEYSYVPHYEFNRGGWQKTGERYDLLVYDPKKPAYMKTWMEEPVGGAKVQTQKEITVTKDGKVHSSNCLPESDSKHRSSTQDAEAILSRKNAAAQR